METSGVFAASNSCCLRDYRLNDKNRFPPCISLPCLPLVIILFYLVWWWGLVFSLSVIKIFKDSVECVTVICVFRLLICLPCSGEWNSGIRCRPIIVWLTLAEFYGIDSQTGKGERGQREEMLTINLKPNIYQDRFYITGWNSSLKCPFYGISWLNDISSVCMRHITFLSNIYTLNIWVHESARRPIMGWLWLVSK